MTKMGKCWVLSHGKCDTKYKNNNNNNENVTNKMILNSNVKLHVGINICPYHLVLHCSYLARLPGSTGDFGLVLYHGPWTQHGTTVKMACCRDCFCCQCCCREGETRTPEELVKKDKIFWPAGRARRVNSQIFVLTNARCIWNILPSLLCPAATSSDVM